MKQKHEFKSIVAETLLIPLYMRAKESRRDNPILFSMIYANVTTSFCNKLTQLVGLPFT